MKDRIFPWCRLAVMIASVALVSASMTGEESGWAVYGGDTGKTHFSRLRQITPGNVAGLHVAWQYDAGDATLGSEIECNPIVVDGVLYATTPKLKVFALNAATGEVKWTFDGDQGEAEHSLMRNRGVAFWDGVGNTKSAGKRIFFTKKQYLWALDAASGKVIESFGKGGRIDLREGLGRDPATLSVSATTPPVIYQGLLIMGSIVSESLPSAPGDIRAYDAVNGEMRWCFHTIPHPGEPGYETWPKDAWTRTGGVNNWNGATLDERRGIVYVPTGSAAFDFYGGDRVGDNLYANCVLALDAKTGKRLWHFQTVKHDIWDRDLPAPPALVTMKRDGKPVDALAQITKSGLLYLLNRDDGTPLYPLEQRAFPKSDVEGEQTAAFQLVPTLPAPFARQRLTESELTDRAPEIHNEVLGRFRKLRSNGQFVPPSMDGTIIFPGLDGGGEWGGPSFDPDTGTLYVNANEMAWVLRLVRKKPESSVTNGAELYAAKCAMCHRPDRAGSPPEFPSLQHLSDRRTDAEITATLLNGAGRMPSFRTLPRASIEALVAYVGHDRVLETQPEDRRADASKDLPFGVDGYNRFLDSEGYPAVKPPWGTLTAIDLNTARTKWQIPLGEYPALTAQGLRNTGSENYGGAIVTENGLLFIAATSFDRRIRAFDKNTGKLLWQAALPFSASATPALYQANGKEFLVIGCGGGKGKEPSGGIYVAYALP